MSEKPRVDVLMLKLNDLVEWEPFALQLGMSPAEIQIIVVNNNGVQAQKQALFTNWLRKYPSASMGQVVQALTLVGENAIAFNLVEQEVPNVDASGENTSTTTATGPRPEVSSQSRVSRTAVPITAGQKRASTRSLKDVQHVKKRNPSPANPVVEMDGYLNVLLIGKTGQGKSTTGNKLLGTNDHLRSNHSLSMIKHPLLNEPSQKFFTEGCNDEPFSVTKHPRLLLNSEREISVLDTPGLGDTDEAKIPGQTIEQANLKLFRKIFIYQTINEIVFDHILYFIPGRGAPEKADAYLIEELKVMKYFCGSSIFHAMTLVVTRDRLDEPTELSSKHIERIEKVYREAFRSIGNPDIECPPIIYIAYNDSGETIRQKIESARIQDVYFEIQFRMDRCCKCSAKLFFTAGKDEIEAVRYGDRVLEHEKSSCHPQFIPRYSQAQKIAGTVAKVVTLGTIAVLEYMLEYKILPDVYDYEEQCLSCKKGPGSEGCCPVGSSFSGVEICHSSTV